MSGVDEESPWDKNFKIPKRRDDEVYNNSNQNYNAGNSLVNNPYYEYYNQYPNVQWQQTTAYPQQYYGSQGASANIGHLSSVEPITQNIFNTLSNIKERPKNYQKNIFKDTVPDVEDQSLPKELTSQFQPLFCKLCSAQLSSNVMAKLHYKSKNHEKKVRKFLVEYAASTGTPLHKRAKAMPSQKTEEESDPKWFHCDICDLPLTGKMHAESHYMGKNHQKVVMGYKAPAGKGYYSADGKWIRQAPVKRTALEDGEDTFGTDFKKQKIVDGAPFPGPSVEPPQAAQSKFHCTICNVGTTCQEQLEIHYLGQKHKKKLKQFGLLDATADDSSQKGAQDQDLNLAVYRTPSGDYYCPLCNLTLSSGIHFKLHIRGKQHLKKTSQKNS